MNFHTLKVTIWLQFERKAESGFLSYNIKMKKALITLLILQSVELHALAPPTQTVEIVTICHGQKEHRWPLWKKVFYTWASTNLLLSSMPACAECPERFDFYPTGLPDDPNGGREYFAVNPLDPFRIQLFKQDYMTRHFEPALDIATRIEGEQFSEFNQGMVRMANISWPQAIVNFNASIQEQLENPNQDFSEQLIEDAACHIGFMRATPPPIPTPTPAPTPAPTNTPSPTPGPTDTPLPNPPPTQSSDKDWQDHISTYAWAITIPVVGGLFIYFRKTIRRIMYALTPTTPPTQEEMNEQIDTITIDDLPSPREQGVFERVENKEDSPLPTPKSKKQHTARGRRVSEVLTHALEGYQDAPLPPSQSEVLSYLRSVNSYIEQKGLMQATLIQAQNPIKDLSLEFGEDIAAEQQFLLFQEFDDYYEYLYDTEGIEFDDDFLQQQSNFLSWYKPIEQYYNSILDRMVMNQEDLDPKAETINWLASGDVEVNA